MAIVIRIVLGIVFFLLGFVGIALPLLPGWLFFALAAVLIVPEHRASQWVLARVEARSPRFTAFLRRLGVHRKQ